MHVICATHALEASLCTLVYVCVGKLGVCSCARSCADAHPLCSRVHSRPKQKPPDFTRAGDSTNHIFPDRKVPLTSLRSLPARC